MAIEKAIMKEHAMISALIELLAAKGILDPDDLLRITNRAKDNYEKLNLKYGDMK